jgi:hypothetical protein
MNAEEMKILKEIAVVYFKKCLEKCLKRLMGSVCQGSAEPPAYRLTTRLSAGCSVEKK